jgi:hypothetical protein
MALDLGRYGSREIMDLQIFNYSTKKPYLVFDYATSVQMENTAEVVYARGGRGNPRRISWHGDKETTITIETQIFTMQHLALLAGENIAKKNEDIFKVEGLTVQDDSGAKVVTLSKTPIGDVSVYSYKNGILVDDQPVLNVTGNEVTLGIDATVNAGDEVQVFYQWTATSAHTLNFTARGVPPYVFMVGDTLYADEVAGVDVAMQVKYYKARLRSDFTISFAPTGDPSTLSLVFDVFPVKVNGVDTLYTMSIYEDE